MQAENPHVSCSQSYLHGIRHRLCAMLSHLIKASLFCALLIFSVPISSAFTESNYEALLTSISSPLPEYGLVISPDGNTAVFSRMSGAWGNPDNQSTLYVTHKNSGRWTIPKHLFDDSFKAGDPFFSLDGASLFFTTNQTLNGTQKQDEDIWLVDHKAGEFTNPRPLTVVNSSAMESSPVQIENGSLYFSSMRPGGIGAGDIWVSRYINGSFQTPENVGAPVNSVFGEWNIFVEKNERFLIVETSGRPDGESASGDLYLYEQSDGNWNKAIPLSHINTTGSDLMPRLSNDGKTFFYTSSGAWKSKDTEILQIKASDFLSPPVKRLNRSLVVVSRSNHEAVALNPDTLEVIARYPTGPGPHEIAAAPGGATLYAPAYGIYPKPHEEPILPSQMQFTSQPSDTLTRVIVGGVGIENTQIPICARSHGVTVSPDGHVWVTCENESRVMELDGTSGTLINNWSAGDKGSHILVATRDNRYVVTSNVDSGSISIFDRTSAAVKTVITGNGAEGLALAPDHKSVWVGNTQANTISIVRISDGSVMNEFSSQGRFPVKMVIAENSAEVWVINSFSREIAILNYNTGEFIEKLTFASPPLGIQISPDQQIIYATFPRLNEVRAFKRETRQEIARTDQVMEGDGMTWAWPP